MCAKLLLFLAGIAFFVAPLRAQAPSSGESNQAATLKLLQDIKAANEQVLSKQAATLERLAELEKAAEQIKIYSKRG